MTPSSTALSAVPKVATAQSLRGPGTASTTPAPAANSGLDPGATTAATSSATANPTAAATTPASAARPPACPAACRCPVMRVLPLRPVDAGPAPGAILGSERLRSRTGRGQRADASASGVGSTPFGTSGARHRE